MAAVVISIIAIIALAATNIYTLYTNHKESIAWQNERKDLYDRIMSKDLQEYKWLTEEVKIYEPVSKSDNDLYEQEQEEKDR